METIVLYPSPGMGHLISMVEFCKVILKHHPNFSITILTVPPSFNTGSTTTYISKISTTIPSIKFHHLPQIPLNLDSYSSMESILFELLNLTNPHVRTALQTINTTNKISAMIIDLFCTTSLSISKELNIPTYYFYTSGVSVLALCLYFPQIHQNTNKSLKDMKNTLLHVPGVCPNIPACDVMKPLLNRDSQDFNGMFQFCLNLPNSDGILVNSFDSLETGVINAIREGKCNPDGIIKTPPIFCVGPLLASEDRAVDHDCLKWLDLQPDKSVIFLSFGSLGLFSGEQLKEIAMGLERSGHRFLWTVRSPPEEKGKRFLPPEEPELDSLLPAGFLERTKDRGFVVKSWAPQVAVLRHHAVGGFVTHCGWNSVLEAIVAGVPMIAWPLYAEQHHNRLVLVEEMKVALRINESEENGFVAAEEVERRVKELMDTESEKGKEVRKVVEQRSLEAKEATSEGGSSIAALAALSKLWKRG